MGSLASIALSLDKNICEYLSERYALLTAKRFYFFRYIVFSGMVCGGYFETVIDGHSTYLQHFTYLIVFIYIHIIPAACFLHFVATEDSLKARSSLETKCNVSQRMEGMTEDHEGIFVDIMPRNHLCLFLTKWEKRRRRTRGRKNRDGERNKTPAAEFLSQEYTTWYMPNKCPPRGGMVIREIDWTLSFREIIIVTKAFFFRAFYRNLQQPKNKLLRRRAACFRNFP